MTARQNPVVRDNVAVHPDHDAAREMSNTTPPHECLIYVYAEYLVWNVAGEISCVLSNS